MLEKLEQEVEQHVKQLFEQADTSKLYYHNEHHTIEVVRRVKNLGLRLTQEEQSLLTIAAWFHDVGYLFAYDNHEDRGMLLAQTFLEEKKILPNLIKLVVGCIEATKLHVEPRNELENIIKDADIGFGVTENFFQTGPLLRKEWEVQLDKYYSNADWERLQQHFLETVQFYSPIGIQEYTPLLQTNKILQKERINGII